MMRLHTLIVDDEWLALEKMKMLLADQQNPNLCFEKVEACIHPSNALELAQHIRFDAAFLDIEMPEINGLELAWQLLQLQPGLPIIFLTAYQEYAVKAFDIHALDYLLKPVHPERLAVSLDRLHSYMQNKPSNKDTEPASVMLCCLQRLHYHDAKGAIQQFSWKTQKAQELFAYLLYNKNRTIHKQSLMDLLWPSYDTKRATAQLHTAIYHIRKTIERAGLDLKLEYKDEGYRVVVGELTFDFEEWERQVRSLPQVDEKSLEQHLDTLQAYTGNFLEEHHYPWAESEWERLRLLWLKLAEDIAEYYMGQEHYTEALILNRKIIERFPISEEGYFRHMQIHALLHQPQEVKKYYNQLERMCQNEFEDLPSEDITAWYREWMLQLKQER